jgi:hypothetical protein
MSPSCSHRRFWNSLVSQFASADNLNRHFQRANLRHSVTFLILFLISRLALGQPQDVRVTLLTDERLPGLSDPQIASILNTARAMIAQAYGKDVSFSTVAARSLSEHIDLEHKRLAPYVVPRADYYDIFNDDIQRFRQHIFLQCRHYGTVDQIRMLLDPGERDAIQTHAQAANALTARFLKRLEGFKKLNAPDGLPLLRPDDWRQYASGEWDIFLWSRPEKQEIDLYLSNALMIESVLYTAPHSLISGLVNGLASPVTRSSIVAYHPILSDNPALAPHRLGKLTEAQKHALIAYVVAHEVGTHMMMHHADAYERPNWPARPGAFLTDISEVTAFRNWKPVTEPKLLDMKQLRLGHAMLHIDLALAKNDDEALLDHFERAQKLGLGEADLARLEARIHRAVEKRAARP